MINTLRRSSRLAKLEEVIEMMQLQMGDGNIIALVFNATPLQQAMFPLIVAWLHLWSLTITIPKTKATRSAMPRVRIGKR